MSCENKDCAEDRDGLQGRYDRLLRIKKELMHMVAEVAIDEPNTYLGVKCKALIKRIKGLEAKRPSWTKFKEALRSAGL